MGFHLVRSARQAVEHTIMLVNLSRDLRSFLRTPITVAQAETIVKQRLEARPERFVTMLERAVYGHPESPYLRLVRNAGCELDDIRQMVTGEGVEGALENLLEAGVHVSYDEYKGNKEAVRGSQRFTFDPEDFDNPGRRVHFNYDSSGTRSPSTVTKGLDGTTEQAIPLALALHAHGLSDADHVVWRTGPLPILRSAKLGRPPIAWFHPISPIPFKVRAGAWYLTAVSRLAGCPLPGLTYLDVGDSRQLVGWLESRLSQRRSICLTTRPSSAVRLATTAQQMNVSLGGVGLVVGGEPYTEAQKRIIEDSGARALVRYSTSESGVIGYSCAAPQVADDLHFLSDSMALVILPRDVGDFGLSVQALLFTSFHPNISKVLLNVENGDYGVFERRSCGCALEAVGLRDHLSQVRSFEKLTSEGMTFVKTRLEQVLQEVLPARFGGSSADYQIVEEEASGIRRLFLLVSPTIGAIEEGGLKSAFLAELTRDGETESFMARTWERAGTIEVRRQAPVATRAGKVFPFHLIKNTEPGVRT